MKKIPTVFKRGDDGKVVNEVFPGCEWVLDGNAIATVKVDGTAVRPYANAWGSVTWYRRRTVKHGKRVPNEFISVDTLGDKSYGWVPVAGTDMEQPLVEALRLSMWLKSHVALPGLDTYELVGPKVNGNPHGYEYHSLIPHGSVYAGEVPTNFEGIRDLLAELNSRYYFEGFVFYDVDGRRAKIKAKDFA